MSDLRVNRPPQPWSSTDRARLDTWSIDRSEGRSLSGSPGLRRRSPTRLMDARVTAAGLALSALVVVAMVIGTSVAVFAASAIALAAAMFSPMTGLIALALTAPLPRPLEIPAPGLYFAMTVAILVGVVLRLPLERPRMGLPSPAVMLLGAFFVYVSVQFAAGLLDGTSVARSDEIASLFNNIATGVLAFTAASVVLRGRSPYPILTTLLISALLASAIALAQSIGAEGLFGELSGPSKSADRMTGPFGDPNYFGAYLSAAVTLAVACAALAKSPWLKALLLGVAGFISVGLLLTLSRGGVVALAVGLATIAFLSSRRAGLVTVAGMLFIVVIAYPMFAEVRYGASSEIVGRGLSAQFEESDRMGVWLPAIPVIESAPLFGVGFGRFAEEASSADSAHNWYLNILAEGGITGLVLWVLFIIAVGLALRRKPAPARMVGLSVLATWMVSSFFLDVPNTYQATGPVLIALAAALAADWAPGTRVAAAGPEEEPPRPTNQGPALSKRARMSRVS